MATESTERKIKDVGQWPSVSGLQRELRAIYEFAPPRQATVLALQKIGTFFDAAYLVMHARFAVHLISEEWSSDSFDPPEPLREIINDSLMDSMTSGTSKCVRLGRDNEVSNSILSSVLYDEDLNGTGGATVVLGPTSRMAAVEALSIFEGIIGFLGVLIGNKIETVQQQISGKKDNDGVALPILKREVENPIHLAFSMVASMKNRHGFDQTCVGYVVGDHVKVVGISGFDEVRASNPGVKLIRQAMEECLDREEIVVNHGYLLPEDAAIEDDFRLHANWSRRVGGDAVASFPIFNGDETVAIASIRHSASDGLDRALIERVATEMNGYGPLVPLSIGASRTFVRHFVDNCRLTWKSWVGTGKRKFLIMTAFSVLLLGWLFLGELSYSLTVPCRVVGAELKMISCPRDGVLERLLAHPGDRVIQGQVLAELDSREYQLQRLEYEAEIASTKALADQARAQEKPGDVRILNIRVRRIQADLDLVMLFIEQSKIRASKTGIILEGDLRTMIGARLSVGDPMFEIASPDTVMVEIQIPERQVLDARSCKSVLFASSARPQEKIPLSDIVIAPSSVMIEGKHVFTARTIAFESPERIAPGMSGFVLLELESKPVWWLLSHRILDWMRLKFWL